MEIELHRDPLTLVGLPVGVGVLLAALLVLGTAPWQHGSSTAEAAIQIGGNVLTGLIGVGLILLILRPDRGS